MADPLPPGPAFIAAPKIAQQDPAECPLCREIVSVPPGYIWRPATDHSMAGWARPSGGSRDD